MKVRIPTTLEIGGLTYEVCRSPEIDEYLAAGNWNGECCLSKGRIKLRTNLSPSLVAQTYWHEVLHAVNDAYCCNTLSEDEVDEVAQGVSQVLKQMGVEVVVGE